MRGVFSFSLQLFGYKRTAQITINSDFRFLSKKKEEIACDECSLVGLKGKR